VTDYPLDNKFFIPLAGLHTSARHGLVENCQFLLEHTGGIHGNEVDSVGQTALFHAVEGGHAECVEYLLSSGLSPDHKNSEDRTYVTTASDIKFSFNLAICRYL